MRCLFGRKQSSSELKPNKSSSKLGGIGAKEASLIYEIDLMYLKSPWYLKQFSQALENM